MPAGRPSKYSEEILEKTKDYLKNHAQYGDAVPTTEGLALHLGLARQTLYNWDKGEIDVEFLDTFDLIQRKQKNLLIQNGLKGEFNSAITKLMLGNHGLHERTELSDPQGNSPFHTVGEALKAALKK